MLHVQAVIKEKVDKIYILKNGKILIYQKDKHILCVINQNTFMKEFSLDIKNKLDDLIILSTGNIAVSVGESVFIHKIDKKEFQEIKLTIKKRNLRSFYFRENFIPDFIKAKCGEYENAKYLLILKRIPFDDSKYGLYNCDSIIDIFYLNKDEQYSFKKSVTFPVEIKGRMLYNNNYLLIHGIQGGNPMTTTYSVYSFDLENKKTKELNTMSFFNEKHKLYFISDNKVLHYYTEFRKSYIYIYNLENNNETISKTIENKDNYKVEYLNNNEKYIYFILVKEKEDNEEEEEEKLIADNELSFYKYNYNLNLIEEIKCSYKSKIGFNKVITIKSNFNLLILYGFNKMVILREENLLDNEKDKI